MAKDEGARVQVELVLSPETLRALGETIAQAVLQAMPAPAPRQDDKLPRYLTVKEAAKLLRRSPRCLARWESTGLIRLVRPAGGTPLVERAELERILTEGRG